MRPNLPLNKDSRRWRAGMLIACAIALAFAVDGFVQCTPLVPWCSTTMGFTYDNLSGATGAFTVTSVDKNGPAARLRSGDRIYLRGLSFPARWRLRDVIKGYGGVAGESWRYRVGRNSSIFATDIAVRRVPPRWGTWIDWTFVFTNLWAVFFIFLLMTRRPDLVEARLLALIVLFMVNVNGMTGVFVPWPSAEFLLWFFGASTLWAVPYVCLALYAARIGKPLSRVRAALTAFTLFTAALITFPIFAFYVFGFIYAMPWAFSFPVIEFLLTIPLLASLACIIAAAMAANGDERQRALWVFAAVTPVWLFYAFAEALWRAHVPAGVIFAFLTIVGAWLPLALAYAVVSRRCIDIGYVINRALIFGLLSAVVLGVFIVVEWALTEWVQNASRSTSAVINIAVALTLGLSIRFLHARIEQFVDSVFFRRRRENEAALRRFAHEAPFITRRDVLLTRAEDVIKRHADATTAVIFMQADVDENDPAILTMRASHESVELHRYDTHVHGELAFPITKRGRFIGILVCGPKRNGEAYTPEERGALDAVANGIAEALEALTAHPNEEQSDMRSLLLEIRDILKSLSDYRMNSDAEPLAQPGIRRTS